METTTGAQAASMFRDLIGRGDLAWALRLLSEYTTGVVRGRWSLIETPPDTGDTRWDTTLAALTCWAASVTSQVTPDWAASAKALDRPWAPIESFSPLGGYCREFWARQTPPEIAAKRVIFAERELVNP